VTHIVLLNAGAAGMPTDAANAICRRFAFHGVAADVRLVEPGGNIGDAAARAVKDEPAIIVAGGGDGTLNAVAGAIVGHPIAFGVLPLGTLNHFARDAGIPLDLDAAVATICTGDVKDVDVGRVNGQLFLNNSSLGLYPQVVKEREELTERLGHTKWPSFVWAALNVLRRFPFLDVQVRIEGKSASYRASVIFIGNNRYELRGTAIGERHCLDAGYLSVDIFSATSRVELIALAARALLGRLGEARDFISFRTSEVVVRTRRTSVVVALDGEVRRLHAPLVFGIEPRALRILVPAHNR
jgi:YegS/Rv2252/BmrU family lipid kinase